MQNSRQHRALLFLGHLGMFFGIYVQSEQGLVHVNMTDTSRIKRMIDIFKRNHEEPQAKAEENLCLSSGH
jgi:hypothetical protein